MILGNVEDIREPHGVKKEIVHPKLGCGWFQSETQTSDPSCQEWRPLLGTLECALNCVDDFTWIPFQPQNNPFYQWEHRVRRLK